MPSARAANPETDVWPAVQEVVTEFRALGTLVLRRHHLSMGQYLSLHRIQKSRGLRLSVLARELGVSRPATTALVATLEARGWVRREPASADRRGVVVRLTDRTVRMMDGLDREIARVVRRSTRRLPPARRKATVETLREMCEGLRTYRAGGTAR